MAMRPAIGTCVGLLASAIAGQARSLGAQLIVFKEFPARYRPAIECLIGQGFTRIPSLPMTRLCIDYASFDDYMQHALNSATRRKLRKKFEATARASALEMSITNDATSVIAHVYPLYLQVYERSKLHFEKLGRRLKSEFVTTASHPRREKKSSILSSPLN